MTPCANMLRRQAASGTAIWLRGAWHRFLSSKRVMHHSVLLHMRLISESQPSPVGQKNKDPGCIRTTRVSG